ncbi:hypothetical protein ACTG9Q_20730 [Actinokineospora sp. 24-640]
MRKTLLALAALTPLLATPAQAEAPTDVSWTPDISVVDADDSNVTATGGVLTIADARKPTASLERGIAMGVLVLAPTTLPHPVNRVAAAVTGAVPDGSELAVDLRGVGVDGQWTEWTEARPGAPAVLPEPTTVVQVRAVLTAGPRGQVPVLRRVELTADLAAGAGALAAPLSYRVYATREGLVGGTTANGHVITQRDHFVALPSRRGLAPKGTGDYSVKVCAANGRCEWAPVWDVGPWNTKDDYWNAPSVREMWRDLPQGKPQAQAAYQDGYNGGRDQYGRQVANPAGIDLADGTFWDGLLLTDNAWVTVTYLWTGSGLTGQIRTAGDPLNVRSSASTGAAQVGLAANYAQVHVECQVTGTQVTGSQGTSNVWFRISAGKFVAKAYMTGVSSAPGC